MILHIEPDVGTYLDALTGVYRADTHVERRIVEAWFACIGRKGGTTAPSGALFDGSVKQWNTGIHRAPRDVARALGDADERAIATSSANFAAVLIARRMFQKHVAELRESIKALQFNRVRSADDHTSESEVVTPATACDIAAIGFSESADRVAYHLAQLDATLFELLTRLPVAIDGPRSPRPFPEDELCAAGFPTVEERTAWASAAFPTLPVYSLGTPQQPITRATVHGGRLRSEN